MANLTKKTINLLRRIEDQILEEPKRLDMDDWGNAFEKTGNGVPACKTQGCIAGWAILLKDRKFWKDLVDIAEESGIAGIAYNLGQSPADKGRELLDLTHDESEKLFYINEMDDEGLGWPVKFSKQYRSAKTAAGRARATVNRIEHFIKTDGAE